MKRKMAPTEVLAELSYLEFHNTKGTLANGTYRVIEHDETVSYAVLGDFRGTLIFDIDWYTEHEYDTYREQEFRSMQDDFALRDIMGQGESDDLDEELMDSWDRAMGRIQPADLAEAEYDNLCVTEEQNRRDGIYL